MKKLICIAVSLLALVLTPAFAQTLVLTPAFAQTPNLTKFDLNFPGGTPADLIQAIEKTTGKSLNVIIPTVNADTQLPELKMNGVTIPQLFDALEAASKKIVVVDPTGSGFRFGGSYSQQETDYGFRTADNPVTDSSVWYFYVNGPTLPPALSTESICKFYQLQPYLNYGFTVDDITTAIQTGWKMAGITSPPELNYHKETNLLIAFGKPDDLATIQNVLDTLPKTSVDKGQMSYLFKQANKIDEEAKDVGELESLLRALSERVDGQINDTTKKADKINDLESQIRELSAKVSTLEKNSGK